MFQPYLLARSFNMYTSNVPLDAELNKLSYSQSIKGHLRFPTESIAHRFLEVTQLTPLHC